MSHKSQMQFVEYCRSIFPERFRFQRVLEIGSRNINGSVRDYFFLCDYTGLDCTPGTDVDVVSLAHEYDADPFDVVISCECFEHDPHLEKTLANIARLLKPRGLFVATWAGPARAEHGTKGTGDVYGPDPEHYRNIAGEEFLAMIGDDYYPRKTLAKTSTGGVEDVYFWGMRS